MKNHYLLIRKFLFAATLLTLVTLKSYSQAGTHLSFDGVNDYVAIPASAAIPVGSSTYTIEFWANPSSINNLGVVGWGNFGTVNQVNAIRFDGSGGIYNYWWGSDLFVSYPFAINTWYHIAATYDGTTRKIYINGVLSGQDTPAPPNVANSNNFRIGTTGAGNYFGGGIDEVRIWNVALSADDVARTRSCELLGNEAGLVAYYKFNQGTGAGSNAGITTLIDATANANTGVLTNLALSGGSSNWLSGSPVITGSSIPTVPAASSPVNYVQGSAAAALTATGTNLLWYTVATGGVGSSTAPTPSTVSTGTTSYWVTSSNASGCQSTRVKIDVIVSPPVPATYLNLDGTNDFISFGNSVTTALAGLNKITVEAWVKPETTSGFGVIVGNYAYPANNGQMQFLLRRDNAAYSFYVDDGTGFKSVSTSAIVAVNSWQHVAGVWNGSDLRIYVNGVLINTTTGITGTAFAITTNSMVMGLDAVGAGEIFKGSIDDIRIWNTNQTADDIARRKNCELTGTEPGLIRYYKFNMGTDGGPNAGVTTIPDATANGNNGTLTNFALSGTTSNWLATPASAVNTGSTIPSAPGAAAQLMCTGSTIADLIPAPGAAINWYNVATGGTVLATNTVLTAGTYYASSVNASGCESTRTPASISLKPVPAFTVSNQTLCANSSTSLIKFTPAATGNVCGTAAENGNVSLTAPAGNTFVSVMFASYGTPTGTCGSFAIGACNDANSVSKVAAAILGQNSVVIPATNTFFSDPCVGTTKSLYVQAGYAPTTVFNWTNSNTSIGLAASGTGATIPAFTALNATTAPVVATITVTATANGCTSIAQVFTITVNPAPFLPAVTTPVTYCQNAPSTALTAAGTGLLWYSAASGGTGSTTAPVPSTVSLGTNSFWVSQTITCGESSRSKIDVITSGQPTLATANTTQILSVPGPTYFSNNCVSLIAGVTPNGASPISGSTTANVWLESAQPVQFVKRHYEITPATAATTATGRITLYFTQQEFTDFNAVNSLKLPIDAADIANNKANLLIEKRGGISSNGTGLPYTYTGTITTINPVDADIIWNATANRWEVSFAVTGFSGFFVKTTASLLPITLSYFNAVKITDGVLVNWQTSYEQNVNHFEVERSNDGISFEKAGAVPANNTSVASNYQFIDNAAWTSETRYYRLKSVDNDGKFSYSAIARVSSKQTAAVNVYPNPVKDVFTISAPDTKLLHSMATLTASNGTTVKSITIYNVQQTVYVSGLAAGVYMLHLANGTVIKLIKE